MAKKVVLEEEEYVEKLGQIIERDFFPDLPTLKKQTMLFRDDGEEFAWTDTTMRATSHQVIASVRTDTSGTGWDDPTPTVSGDAGHQTQENEEEESDTTESMTLNAFVATHTSEDNDSFNELQEKAVKDHQRRYHWAYDDNTKGDPKLHLLTDGTWISKEQRRIADEACAPKGSKDDRPSAPETWNYRARNPLLFSPELPATRDICQVEPDSKKQLLLENGPESRSRLPPKANKKTVYANSRFPTEDARANAEKATATPQKEYPLVPMTPLIAPGVDASPVMTWGDIEGTPMILGSKATPEQVLNTPTFQVQDSSRREKLADRLETQARRRSSSAARLPASRTPMKRARIAQTPTPRSVRARLASRRTVLRTPVGSDAQLRASYSTPVRPPRPSSSKPRKTK